MAVPGEQQGVAKLQHARPSCPHLRGRADVFEEKLAESGENLSTWLWPEIQKVAVDATKEEVSKKLSAQWKKANPKMDDVAKWRDLDVDVLIQKIEEAENLCDLMFPGLLRGV
jgi:hypothetical protein